MILEPIQRLQPISTLFLTLLWSIYHIQLDFLIVEPNTVLDCIAYYCTPDANFVKNLSL